MHLKMEFAFYLFAAVPLNESIAWGGPIVMNTKAELSQAFRDLDEGTFINDKNPTQCRNRDFVWSREPYCIHNKNG